MNITLLTDCFHPVRNGVVHHVELLRRELAAAGVAVQVVAPGPPHPDDGPHMLRYPGLALGATGYHAGWPLDGVLWRALRGADILHAHHPFLSGSLALAAARQSGAPVVLTSHTRYDLYLQAYTPWLPPGVGQPALRTLLRRITGGCAAVIAPSAGAQAALRSWGVAAPVELIPNGIDVARFRSAAQDSGARAATRAALGVGDGTPLAVYVGRIGAEKRVLPLLASFAQVRAAGSDCKLLLVGTGAQEKEARAACAAWGLGNAVYWAGARPYAELPALLAAADLFVSASVSETHPLTFLEAAAAGLPALGIASPGVSDVVEDGITGLLAPAPGGGGGGEGADAGLVVRWLALAGNAPLRREMGAAAAGRAASMDAAVTAQRVLALYRRLLAARGGR